MSLSGALSAANSGLADTSANFVVMSQNIANASTPGYAQEVATQSSVVDDGG